MKEQSQQSWFRKIFWKYGYVPVHRRDLSRLAVYFGTDKEASHFYAARYREHFSGRRHLPLKVLEIGIGGYDNPQKGGGSLRMWRAFFSRASIYGLDLYDKSPHDGPRIKTYRGSQVDRALLEQMNADAGGFDIIIDDGSHLSAHVIETFEILFPLLHDNGIYVVEDLQTSYWDEIKGESWGGSRDLNNPNTSMNYFKQRVDGLNHQEFLDQSYEPDYFDRHIVSMHFYHNLLFIYKGDNQEGSNILSPHRGA